MQSVLAVAQQMDPVASGVITHKDGKMAGFTHLQFIGEKVLYHNVAARKNEVYPLSEIVLIADDDQKAIYRNGEILKKETEVPVQPVVDTLYKPGYPDGVYATKEDFLAKKPSHTGNLIPKAVVGGEYLYDTIADHCFFMTGGDKKLRKMFAVSYKGHLYFRIGAILDNRNKTDRSQGSDFPQSFVRAIMGGDNYYYAEANLANIWEQGLAYGGVGGAAGYYMAQSAKHKKGIVWDIKNKEFNIFKNCKDYNAFIQSILPDAVQTCEERQPELNEIRKAIYKVK